MWRPVVVLLFAASVVSAQDDGKGPKAEFYPTKPGTRWVMRWTYPDGGDPDLDVIGITEERVVNGYRKWRVRVVSRPLDADGAKDAARMLTSPKDSDEVFDAWEFYDVDREAYVSRSVDDPDEVPYVLLRHPGKVGDSHTGVDGVTTRVLETNKTVKVPAGSFKCIVYEIDETGGELETIGLQEDPQEDEEYVPLITKEYWCAGTGLVLAEDYEMVDGQRVLVAKQELISLHVPEK